MKSSFSSSKSQSTFYIDSLNTPTEMSLSSSPECSLTRSVSLRMDKRTNGGDSGKSLTLPKDLERLKEWSSECRSVREEYSASCSADDTVSIEDVDALFGSFSRYTSFFLTLSGSGSCPSSPVSDTPQTTEESVVTAKWFFDIVRQQQQQPEIEQKPLGAQSRASFVEFSGPMLAITHRSVLVDVKPRTAILSKRVFYLFKEANNNPKCKEKIVMSNVISLETSRPTGFKVNKDLFGIVVKVSVDKTTKGGKVLEKKPMAKAKPARQTYLYAVHSEVVQIQWMQKLLESITRRFSAEDVTNCLYASQCYARYTATSAWKRGWVVLTLQRRVVHCFDGGTCTIFDLRKMQQIQLAKEEAIKRCSILVECQPLKLHVIMDSEADTHKWFEMVRSYELNLRNLTLEEQQMTNENVPVVVEKCLRFIFSYGSMSEDIYAVPGNTGKVKRLLEAFRDDAFGVQLAHTQFTEHDVASALQKFLRDLPKTVVGDLSTSFMCVSDILLVEEKRLAYKELLLRLTSVEYQTLRSIIGHLHALHSLKHYNKMNARKLAVIWGKNLLTDLTNESQELFQKEINVVYDLIVDYKEIFAGGSDEVAPEVSALEVTNGMRKVWVKVLPNESNNDSKLHMIPIQVTPQKTVTDVCYELIFEMRLPPQSMTMSEVLRRGELLRPMHPNEIVLDTIQRWDGGEADARDSCLVVVPSKFFNHIEVLSNMKTDFVVRYKCGEQAARQVLVELMDDKVLVLGDERKESLEISAMHAYLNSRSECEVTLIEKHGKRCHTLTVADNQDQVLLYVSIAKRYHQIHSHYETSEI